MNDGEHKDAFDKKLAELMDESDKVYLGEEFTAKVMKRICTVKKPSPIIRFTKIALPVAACAAAVVICVTVGLDRLLPKTDGMNTLAKSDYTEFELRDPEPAETPLNPDTVEIEDPGEDGFMLGFTPPEADTEEISGNDSDITAEESVEDSEALYDNGLPEASGEDVGLTAESELPVADPVAPEASVSPANDSDIITGTANSLNKAELPVYLLDGFTDEAEIAAVTVIDVSQDENALPTFFSNADLLTDEDGNKFALVKSNIFTPQETVDFIKENCLDGAEFVSYELMNPEAAVVKVIFTMQD